MDQGSVVVLRRRAFQFATLPGHPDMDRDLNYSGSIPTATTLIPDPLTVIPIPVANGSGISRSLKGILFYDFIHFSHRLSRQDSE